MAEAAHAGDDVTLRQSGAWRIASLATAGLLMLTSVGCAGPDALRGADAAPRAEEAVLVARMIEAQYARVLEQAAVYLASDRLQAEAVRQLQLLDEAVGFALVRLRLAVRSGDGRAIERDVLIARVAVSQLSTCLATYRDDPVQAAWL